MLRAVVPADAGTSENSDAHSAAEVGLAWSEMTGPVTEENIRRSILEGRTTAGGSRGPRSRYYRSQLVRIVKTRDIGTFYRLGRRVLRRFGASLSRGADDLRRIYKLPSPS